MSGGWILVLGAIVGFVGVFVVILRVVGVVGGMILVLGGFVIV